MKLNKAEQARARVERSILALLLRERSKSNASGTHLNKSNKRARTRLANKSKSIREQL